MKNYRITVNGNEYDVQVEELQSEEGAVQRESRQKPAQRSAAPKAAPAAKKASGGAEGAVKVLAPMPGKIVDVKVSAGQSVKKGAVLVILEAMKMENEIVAPGDGVVATVQAEKGEGVEAGVVLVTLN